MPSLLPGLLAWPSLLHKASQTSPGGAPATDNHLTNRVISAVNAPSYAP